MRGKALLTALACTIIFTGCKNQQQQCAAYASQYDELYMSDYNCVIQSRVLTIPQYPSYYVRPTTYYGYPVTNNYYNCVENPGNIVVTPRPDLSTPPPTQYNSRRPQPLQLARTQTRQ